MQLSDQVQNNILAAEWQATNTNAMVLLCKVRQEGRIFDDALSSAQPALRRKR